MGLEDNYLEYVAEFSISLLAISVVHFVDPSRLYTLSALLMVPLLFGYTAYISRDNFRTSSLLSGVALFYIILDPVFAAVAILIVSGNILVSFFASGNSFSEFYSATTLPLLFTGLILGATAYGVATTQPETGKMIRDRGSQFLGEQAETAVEESNIIEKQKQAQISLIEGTSQGTVIATQAYVLNRTRGDLGPREIMAVNSAFQDAREEIPARISQQAEKQTENATVDVSERTEDLVGSTMDGKAFLLLIPLITFGLYSLQPLIGLLTATAASAFRYLAERD